MGLSIVGKRVILVGAGLTLASAAIASENTSTAAQLRTEIAKSALYGAGDAATAGYKWGSSAPRRSGVHAVVVEADADDAASDGFKWRSSRDVVGSPGADDAPVAAVEAGYKWGVRSDAEQAGYKWGIRSDAEQSGYKWGIRSDAEQSGYKWGIRSDAEQAGYKWGIRSDAEQAGYKWGIR